MAVCSQRRVKLLQQPFVLCVFNFLILHFIFFVRFWVYATPHLQTILTCSGVSVDGFLQRWLLCCEISPGGREPRWLWQCLEFPADGIGWLTFLFCSELDLLLNFDAHINSALRSNHALRLTFTQSLKGSLRTLLHGEEGVWMSMSPEHENFSHCNLSYSAAFLFWRVEAVFSLLRLSWDFLMVSYWTLDFGNGCLLDIKTIPWSDFFTSCHNETLKGLL